MFNIPAQLASNAVIIRSIKGLKGYVNATLNDRGREAMGRDAIPDTRGCQSVNTDKCREQAICFLHRFGSSDFDPQVVEISDMKSCTASERGGRNDLGQNVHLVLYVTCEEKLVWVSVKLCP